MGVIRISDVAYDEFKGLLDQNELPNYIIRINLAGMGWSGPSFNIVLDEQKDTDIVETVKDITFLIDKNLVEDFEGFRITSSAENGSGLMLEPTKDLGESGGCSSCSSCG